MNAFKKRLPSKASLSMALNALDIINTLEGKGHDLEGTPIIEGMGLLRLQAFALELKTNKGKKLLDYL